MLISMPHKENEVDVHTVRSALVAHFSDTRFTCEFRITTENSRRAVISVIGVRLKPEFKKHWCGQHAELCSIQGIHNGDGTFSPGGQEKKSSSLLEGLDWVSFDDQCNDVLDALHIYADFKSTLVPVVMRKGKKRRVHYGSRMLDNGYRREYEWDIEADDEDYQDWCGKDAPASTYPDTPGIYCRQSRSSQESLSPI